MSATSSSEYAKWMPRCLRGEESPISLIRLRSAQIIVETVQVEQYAWCIQQFKAFEGNGLRNLLQCPRAPGMVRGNQVDPVPSMTKQRARGRYCARTMF